MIAIIMGSIYVACLFLLTATPGFMLGYYISFAYACLTSYEIIMFLRRRKKRLAYEKKMRALIYKDLDVIDTTNAVPVDTSKATLHVAYMKDGEEGLTDES